MSSRGIAPIVGVLAMLAVVTTLGGVVAAVVPGVVDSTSVEPISIDLEHKSGDELVYTLKGGSAVDVNELELRILVNGVPLEFQPTVPSRNNHGFRGGPSGAFHAWGTTTWEPGATASLQVGGENVPTIEHGDTITTEFYLDGQLIAETSTTASP